MFSYILKTEKINRNCAVTSLKTNLFDLYRLKEVKCSCENISVYFIGFVPLVSITKLTNIHDRVQLIVWRKLEVASAYYEC